ncbi:MAG: hypothetical protein ACRYF2_15665 [Janthinobacterium lividum]
MASGDGLLVRVKPSMGELPAEAARMLAEAAVAFGNGQIELTGRGALQFRGMTAESAPRFAELVVGLGLAAADAAVERRRSVLVSPLAEARVTALARALEAAIVRDDGLAALPAKFGFGVEGGGVLPLGGGADITLVVEKRRCLLVPDGADRAVLVDDPVPATLRMAHVFLAVAGSERRMRHVVAEVLAGYETVPFEAAEPMPAIGWLPGGMTGAGLRFGAMDAAVLTGLAGLAGGDGVLRLTPWRAVLVPGAPDEAALERLGLIVAADDPALQVSACVGAPGCVSGSVATRSLAAGLRPGPDQTIHVSGCEKGCAHPGAAGLTLVGRAGLFDVVRDGRAGDVPVQHGLRPAEVMQLQ